MTADAATMLRLLRSMLRIRRFEEKIVEVYPAQDMKTPVHLCLGQEAVAAGVCDHLEREDFLFTTHRGHGHCLAKGISPRALYAEFYGRAAGCCAGRGGSMHPADPELGILGTSAIVGGGIPHAVGTALASRLRKDRRVSVTFFGDGAAEEGVFHESLNFAALKALPVVFVCENNGYAVNSPLAARQPQAEIFRHAQAYGMVGQRVDGNDVLAVHHAAGLAVERARNSGGPTLLECVTYRIKGHVGPECDTLTGCRPQEELAVWGERCPVQTFLRRLMELELVNAAWLELEMASLDASLDADLAWARACPLPAPDELLRHVYWESKQAGNDSPRDCVGAGTQAETK